jgi:hypothetical protein
MGFEPSAADIIARLALKPHPEAGIIARRFAIIGVTPDARCRQRSISCWRAASARTGIASMRWRSGITAPAAR